VLTVLLYRELCWCDNELKLMQSISGNL